MGNRSDSLTRWSGRSLAACVIALFLGLNGQEALAQDPASTCTPAVGRIVSLQGSVELQRAGGKDWEPVKRLDTSICAGDRLRTGALSRAALFVQPETIVRVDQNTTITLNQANEEIEVEFFAAEFAAEAINAKSFGAAYFITRFPKKFKVKTPHVNAAVEGTEFMVELSSDATKLTVIEGKVSSESVTTRDTQMVTAGQSLASGAAGLGAITTVIKPQDAVQWVLRYPPISDQSESMRISNAERLLRTGSVDAALSAVESELKSNSSSSEAYALRSVIQVTKNDKVGALESARKATELDAQNYRGWLALSYAQQAAFDLEAALETARKAESIQPASALAHARVAELYLSLGNSRRAESAALAAIKANAAESYAHSMLGFVHLAQVETRSARSDFVAAIECDSFAAMPRLGLGLATIRDGDLVAGREQIEIAVALDPSNSLLRSYVGKAYYEENTPSRDVLAATQFGIAKGLDDKDPTPWYYDAIYRDSENRPVDALENLQASILRNDNRAVYRSALLVDDDAAARAASVANIYQNLGFEKLAISESAKALGENPSNFSAHHQLADAYSNLPRHDIARVSEELQAQLRQPVALSSVGPQVGTDNLAISKDSGPARPGANEFNALFNQDGTRVRFEGIAGNLNTWGDQFVGSALANKFSLTLSQLHYETDGFTENDAAVKDIYGLIAHAKVSPSSSLQVELKRTELDIGHTFFSFDEFPFPLAIGDQSDSIRISGFHDFDASGNWIWSGIVEDRKREIRSSPDGALFTNSEAEPFAVEAEYTGAIRSFDIVTGVSYIQEVERFELEQVDIHKESASAFLYAHWHSRLDEVSVEAGVAAEWYKQRSFSQLSPDQDALDRNQLSPKLGIVWTPAEGTTIRAAGFSAVRRPFIRSQTIEPTQVAGFNQFFTGFERFYGDVNGVISDRIAIAIDQGFSKSVFGGLEVTAREVKFPSFGPDGDFTWQERSGHAYAYWTFSTGLEGPLGEWQGSLSADVEYEKIERPQKLTGAEGIIDLETVSVPLGLRIFNDVGTTVRLATTFIRQNGTFSIDVPSPDVSKDEEGWITDISIEQLLPRRHGSISLGVRNIFDDGIDLVEIDPLNPRVATKQFVYGAFKFVF